MFQSAPFPRPGDPDSEACGQTQVSAVGESPWGALTHKSGGRHLGSATHYGHHPLLAQPTSEMPLGHDQDRPAHPVASSASYTPMTVS